MFTTTILSLTRSIALRVPLVTLKSTAAFTLQRSPFLSTLSTYRALSSSSPFAAAAKSNALKTAGRTKTQPKTKAKPKPKTKVKAKVKAKAKPKAKPKSKRKVAAKPKPKVSTRVAKALRPPRRPPTEFLLFYRRSYPSLASRSDGITSASKDAGELWHKLPDTEKQAFRDEARTLMAHYRTKRDEWYKKPENLKVLRTLNKDRKKRGKNRIVAPSTDAPKRPLNSYMRFVQELKETNKLSIDHAPEGTSRSRLIWAARETGTRWNALPAAEKEKYSKAYHADLVNWKAANATASA